MEMDKLLDGVHAFRNGEYVSRREFFEHLAQKQQKPRALFITCSDSRVDPNLITQTEPGDLFLIRNAGNIVPPYGAAAGGEQATIEYSIAVLGIKNIIVCGHSQCGAMRAMLDADGLGELPSVRGWFAHAESTRRIVREKYMNLLVGESLAIAATEENVLVQMNHVSTHPYVASRMAQGQLHIFGWYYDIGTGQILQYDQAQGQFVELGQHAVAVKPLPIRSAVATA